MILWFLLLVASIQKLPAASVLTDINFPMKGRKGMVDWARNSEDRVVIPKNIFTPMSTGKKAYQHVNFLLALARQLWICLMGSLYNMGVVLVFLFKRNTVPVSLSQREINGLNFSTLNKKCCRNPRHYFLHQRNNALLSCCAQDLICLIWGELKCSSAEPLEAAVFQQTEPFQHNSQEERKLSRQMTLTSGTIYKCIAVQISDIREFTLQHSLRMLNYKCKWTRMNASIQ